MTPRTTAPIGGAFAMLAPETPGERMTLLTRPRVFRMKGDRWAFDHDRCAVCGTTEVRHRAHGQCETCYRRAWHQNRKAERMVA